MLPLIAFGFGAIGFVTVLCLVPVIIGRIAPAVSYRREMHQTHKTPVPRLGGIALASAFILVTAASFIFQPPMPGHPRLVIGLTSLAMFILGLCDDISPIGAKKKLIGQVAIAVAAFYFGLRVETFRNPVNGVVYQLGTLSLFATVFWLVAMTNVINLIDGVDGLASGISLMLMCLLVYVSFHTNPFCVCIAMGMVGALIGFLYFNFPPAKIYLGDGGAYFLGYLIGALALQNANKGTIAAALIAPVFALAVPILDVSFSIVRRGLKGLPIFRPDRRHIHHRLLQTGWSRQRVVLTLYGLSFVFLTLSFLAFWSDGKLTPVLIGCGFAVIVLVAPRLGMIKNWLTVGATLGHSLELRKAIQYAMLHKQWLLLEADRASSVASLWQDFTFVCGKLGFREVALSHRNTRCAWEKDMADEPLQTARHELHVGDEAVILELAALADMDEKVFNMLAELAAEMWLTSARKIAERNPGEFVIAEQSVPRGALEPTPLAA
jgi:UDP-GlcNAc:undecaprenyl-phosphate/decaprenyl-phosphate GlcNAc-1-phosphate transferase